jgi:hypothetical protein
MHVEWDPLLDRSDEPPPDNVPREEGCEKEWVVVPVEVVYDEHPMSAHPEASWVMMWQVEQWAYSSTCTGRYKPPGYGGGMEGQEELRSRWEACGGGA